MNRTLSTAQRFAILVRDNFECQFCGARPGNDRLHVDHLIPHAQGGSDDEANLATACDRCNNGKGNQVLVPRKLLEQAEPDKHGFVIWKRFGDWNLEVKNGDGMILNYVPEAGYYWIAMDRWHEPDWDRHLLEKNWCTDKTYDDFVTAITFARRLMRKT